MGSPTIQHRPEIKFFKTTLPFIQFLPINWSTTVRPNTKLPGYLHDIHDYYTLLKLRTLDTLFPKKIKFTIFWSISRITTLLTPNGTKKITIFRGKVFCGVPGPPDMNFGPWLLLSRIPQRSCQGIYG